MPEDINKLNICMSSMKKDIEYIKDSLVCNKEDHKEMLERIDKWIEKAERRYAPIWVANTLKWVMTIVGAALIAAILSLVII